jgi:prepilin signal peptidase PulO-like enzyme (type II secretory pathway)
LLRRRRSRSCPPPFHLRLSPAIFIAVFAFAFSQPAAMLAFLPLMASFSVFADIFFYAMFSIFSLLLRCYCPPL